LAKQFRRVIYLLSFLLGIPSPVLMFLNAEAWTVSSVLLSEAHPLGIGACVALGQSVGYSIVYFNGPWILAKIPRLQQRLDRFDVARYEKLGYLGILVGSLLNFPPPLLFTLLRRQLRFRFALYLATIIVSRTARFCILATLPEVFATWLKVR
jgi:membrane protein YqaA with SNARE-associated domain